MSDSLSEAPSMPLLSPARMKSEPVERPQSPEANCAICLEEFNNKSYTDSCLHEFCFICLKEWSKIKPECPLCKQRFQTIIHNIRSHQEYDEYHVSSHHGTGVPLLDTQSVLLNLAFQRASVYTHQAYRPTNSSYRAIMDNSIYHRAFDSMTRTPLLYIHPSSVVRAPENNHSPTFDQDFGATISVGRARNRRDVYRHDRWVRPSLSSRIRETSPEFYRLNPATTHRLAPWLTRELNVLLDVSVDPQVYCQEILRLITIYPIRSRQFREALRPVLGERVEHFIHEFYHFAISVHDMVSYDIVAEYEPGSRPVRRFARAEPSDSDSDIEVVRVLPTTPTQCTGLDLSNRAGPSNASSEPTPQVVIEINDTSSSDDEVEIISVRAPTPETIIIDSSESEAEIINEAFTNQNCPGRCSDDPECSHRSECSLGSRCDSMRNMLHGIEDEIIENYSRNPSLFENGSRSPTPPMPYLRPMNSKEPSSPSASESCSSRCCSSLSHPPTPSSSSSSSWSSSSSDSDYTYGKRRSTYKKKKKKVSSTKQGKSRKRPRKSLFKIEDSSSDEEYEPRSSRPRLRSVVVKPEPSSSRQHRSSHYTFPNDSD